MVFDIYDLGADWRDVDPVAVLRTGRRGDLRIRKRYPLSPIDHSLVAQVFEPGTRNEIMRPLLYVKFSDLGMNTGSMVIEGTVVIAERQSSKSKTNHIQVAYLCKPPGAPAVLNTEKIRQRRTALQEDMKKDPFHPGFDNDATIYGPLDDSID